LNAGEIDLYAFTYDPLNNSKVFEEVDGTVDLGVNAAGMELALSRI